MSTEAIYSDHFGLTERPFTLQPDPSLLYWSRQHKRAFTILEYGIVSRAPITLITGEIGAGKTTLLQALIGRLEEGVTVGLISNAQGGRGELMQWVLNAFDIALPNDTTDYVQMFQAFVNFVVAEYAEGRRVVLVIDEAQNLSLEGLEEIRMLTNVNSNKDELLQLILVGQPELRDMVGQPEMRQLGQRVGASFHLGPMDAETTEEYVRHRLKLVGGTGDEFASDAFPAIAEKTGGVPRLVNKLCDLAMLYAWSDEQKVVDQKTVQAVLADGIFFTGSQEEGGNT